MAHVNYRGNEYASTLGALLDECPKNVLAAVAVSALTCGGDWLDKGAQRVAREWVLLYQNGIVPQKPTATARRLASLEGEEK